MLPETRGGHDGARAQAHLRGADNRREAASAGRPGAGGATIPLMHLHPRLDAADRCRRERKGQHRRTANHNSLPISSRKAASVSANHPVPEDRAAQPPRVGVRRVCHPRGDALLHLRPSRRASGRAARAAGIAGRSLRQPSPAAWQQHAAGIFPPSPSLRLPWLRSSFACTRKRPAAPGRRPRPSGCRELADGRGLSPGSILASLRLSSEPDCFRRGVSQVDVDLVNLPFDPAYIPFDPVDVRLNSPR